MDGRTFRRLGIAAGFLILLAAPASLTGCGTVNTVSTRSRPSDDSLEHVRVQVNDLLTDIFLHCTGVRMFRTKGGPYEAQVDIANNDFRQRRFAYRFSWLSYEGNVIPSQMSVWKTSSIPSGGTGMIRSIAPNKSATDFRLEIRRSN